MPIVWYYFYVPANGIAWAESYASAERQSAQSGKPILLFFTGKWCVPCRIMKRQVWADNEVKEWVNTKFIPVMIDVDSAEANTVRSKHPFGATPTTMVINAKGELLVQAEGGMNKSEFLRRLQSLEESSVSPST